VPVRVSARLQGAHGVPAGEVEDHLEALAAAGEVLAGVVDHVIRTKGADKLDVARAAHAGHLGTERLGDLHGEGADTARRAVDQHRIAGLHAADVAQALQGGDGPHATSSSRATSITDEVSSPATSAQSRHRGTGRLGRPRLCQQRWHRAPYHRVCVRSARVVAHQPKARPRRRPTGQGRSSPGADVPAVPLHHRLRMPSPPSAATPSTPRSDTMRTTQLDPARRAGGTSPSAPILSARGVAKTYRSGAQQVHALRGIDLDVHPGELVMVMGPSGNGKTTLLNCLSGLDDIDAGTVTVDGVDLFTMSDGDRTRHRARRMGFIFQAFNLIPVLSAAENVELPLLLTGASPTQARKRAADMLARVGLADRGDHRPGELSGGEQQRVTVARALVAEPALVWADEPTGALDSHTAAGVVELLHEVHAAGQALVVVTHDETLGRTGQRLVQVRDGRVVLDGAPDVSATATAEVSA
jgi:putative ABC transport system ATP-binding protein